MKYSDNAIVRIYELRDPRDPECNPKYIGITTRTLKKRLRDHLNKSALIPKTLKNNWIKSLLKDNVKPTIHLIEEVINWKYACEIEKYWIKEFKEQGYELKNGTDGGDGMLGIVLTEEQRRAVSNRLMGGTLSEETKEKISKSHIGYKYDDAAKQNMSKSKIGHKHSPETKLKIGNANKGKIRSKEDIEKTIASLSKFRVSIILIYDNNDIFKFDCIENCAKHLKINLSTAKSYIGTDKNKNRNYKIYRERDYIKFINLKEFYENLT